MAYAAIVASGSPADEAFFRLSRIALDPLNPERDVREAATYLDRLVTEYPQSPLLAEALTWRRLIQTVERQERDRRRYQQDVERLSRELRRAQQEMTKDPEGWPVIPGRYGRLEWHDGETVAVYSNHPRMFARL